MHGPGRAVEGGVAEGEDAAVGGHQPVAPAVGRGGHAHDGLVEVAAAQTTVGHGIAEGGDTPIGCPQCSTPPLSDVEVIPTIERDDAAPETGAAVVNETVTLPFTATASLESVAVYVTDSTLASVTVNVACPLASVAPVTAVICDEPPDALRTTLRPVRVDR